MSTADTHRFQFIAGNLALDFVNTVGYRADPAKTMDYLAKGEDVGRWARQAGLPDRPTADSGRGGTGALRRIRTVRELLHGVFHAIANEEPIPPVTLARIGKALHDCRARRRLSLDGGAVRWTWRADARWTDQVLYPVLSAAEELLVSEGRGSIRQCEDAGCGWLFLDRSNAGRRRWCSMADCGNRNKARAFHRRGRHTSGRSLSSRTGRKARS